MKKLSILIFALLLSCGIAFVQSANANPKVSAHNHSVSTKVHKKSSKRPHAAKNANNSTKPKGKAGGVCFSCVH